MRPVVELFHNPQAGGSSRADAVRLAQAFAQAGARVIKTPCNHESPSINDETTHVCIAGGDGTVRHVAMAIMRSGKDIPAAIWPAGTINLLSRALPPRPDPQGLAQALIAGEYDHPHHPVRLNDTEFCACASVGPDSLAVDAVSPALKRRIGRIAYAVAFFSFAHRLATHGHAACR